MVRGLQFTIRRVYGMNTAFDITFITGTLGIFSNIVQGMKLCDINKTMITIWVLSHAWDMVSLVPSPRPAFRRLQYGKAGFFVRVRGELGDEAKIWLFAFYLW